MKAYTQQNVLNTITTNTFSVIEDLSLNGRILVSGDASLNGRLFVSGNVGIGTTNPAYPLHVNGYIKQTFVGFSYYHNGATINYAIGAQLPIGSGNSSNGYNVQLVDSGHITTAGTFTAPVAGIYTFTFSHYTNSTAACTVGASLRKNATSVTNGSEICGTYVVNLNSSAANATATGVVQLAINDTVTLWASQNNGASLSYSPNSIFCGYLITAV